MAKIKQTGNVATCPLVSCIFDFSDTQLKISDGENMVLKTLILLSNLPKMGTCNPKFCIFCKKSNSQIFGEGKLRPAPETTVLVETVAINVWTRVVLC